MSIEKFELLKSLSAKGSKLSSEGAINLIAELRALAREFISLNNELIDQKYSIKLEITGKNSEKHKLEIINQKIIDTDYSKKIDEMIESIRDLEIQEYGSSEVGGNSPYKL